MRGLTRQRRGPLLALAGLVGLLALGAVALASPSLPIVAPTPKLANQMTNVDVLKQEIKNYYGDPTGTGNFAPDGNYAQEASQVAADGSHWLAARAQAQYKSGKKAIVLDVDDTTLATYNYEVFSNWKYDPATNATYVLGELFPAVPDMVAMVNQAKAEGYATIWLTGRPQSQEAATLGNLLKVGYPSPTPLPDATLGGGSDGIFTKPAVADYPPYLQFCEVPTPTTSCNTDEYKSATRQYIESLGYEIVGNFGDQYSDFSGGFEDRTFKLPNPSYFLP
ncbi:MAG: HAD family acid phosphatase [Gaiellaceae bacterium]